MLLKKILPLLIVGSLVSSCKIGYVPSAVHTPMFKEGGQTNINASLLYKADFQAAHSIDSHFFVHGDFSTTFNETSSNSSSSGNAITNSFTVGAGYYHYFNDVFMFEGLAGFGLGRSEIDYSKFIVQPTMGWVRKHSEIGFTPKFTLVTYDEMGVTAQDVFIEPTSTFRFGGPIVKFQTQIGFAVPVYYTSDVEWIPFNFGIGVNVKFPKSKSYPTNQ